MTIIWRKRTERYGIISSEKGSFGLIIMDEGYKFNFMND